MHTQTAAQKAPRAITPSPEPKPQETESAHGEDRDAMLDDDLYGNLAHTD